MFGGELEQGAMSKVELIDEHKIKKTYFEPTTQFHKPYLFVSSNKVYLFERCTEHEAHEQLVKYLPNEYPKIFSYTEKKWNGEEIGSLLAKMMKRDGVKNEDLNTCEVVMEYLPYEQLDHVIYDVVKNERDAINMMKIYFKKLLNMIKVAHVQPNDFHTGNMLAKVSNDGNNKLEDLFVIDYGWYQRFKLVDVLNEKSVGIGYGLDVKNGEVFKVDVKSGERKAVKVMNEFELNDYDAEMLLMDILSFELKRISVYRCFHLTLQLMFGGRIIDIYRTALKELNCSERFCKLVNDALSNSRIEMSVRSSLVNWLDACRSDCCQTHRLLTMLKVDKDGLDSLVSRFRTEEEKIRKMNNDELFEYVKALTKTEQRYVHSLRNGIVLIHEFMNLLGWVIRNEKKVKGSLFRIEKRMNMINVGDVLKWDNLASASEIKDYALSFGESCEMNYRNYLFEFINVPATYLTHLTEDITTHQMACNRENPDDANYFKFDVIDRIIVGNEYVLNPVNKYKVVDVVKGLKNVGFEYELVKLELSI